MIEPAFNVGDWAKGLPDQLDGYVDWDMGIIDVTLGGMGGQTRDIQKDRHRLAALALYSQPFGFTREHVRALREIANEQESRLKNPHWGMTDDRSRARYQIIQTREAADRIESLLPPER